MLIMTSFLYVAGNVPYAIRKYGLLSQGVHLFQLRIQCHHTVSLPGPQGLRVLFFQQAIQRRAEQIRQGQVCLDTF